MMNAQPGQTVREMIELYEQRHGRELRMHYALRYLSDTEYVVGPADPPATSSGPCAAQMSFFDAVRKVGDAPMITLAPRDLEVCQDAMLDSGICRQEVNARISRIRTWVKRCARYDRRLTEVAAWLESVDPIRRGARPEARDAAEILSVPDAVVRRTLEAASPVLRRAITVQLLTAMRPGELVAMRVGDLSIDPDDRDWWIYRPPLVRGAMKNAWREQREQRQRVIDIPAEAQLLLREQISHVTDQGRLGDQGPEMRLWTWKSSQGYWQAVQRAARRAGCPRWAPNQLRHAAATRIARTSGKSAASQVLGHADPKTVERYLDPDRSQGRRALRELLG